MMLISERAAFHLKLPDLRHGTICSGCWAHLMVIKRAGQTSHLWCRGFPEPLKQSAMFGELRYAPVERLSLTAGARAYFFSRTVAQPESGLLAGTPNDGSIPDPYTAPTERGADNGVVYRGAIRWQQSQNIMYYAQASEGFRGPFGRFAIPNACAAEAATLGTTTALGEVASDK